MKASRAVLGLVVVLAGCPLASPTLPGQEPVAFHVTFTWTIDKPAYDPAMFVHGRVEDRSDPARPQLLSRAEPVRYVKDPELQFRGVEKGDHRVVIMEFRRGEADTSPVQYYGLSQEFSITPPIRRTVDVSVPLGPVPCPVAGERDDGCRISVGCDVAVVPEEDSGRRYVTTPDVNLCVSSVPAVAVRVSNARDFPSGATALLRLDQAPATTDGTGWFHRGVPWRLAGAELPECRQAGGCKRQVFVRFVDTWGYESETLTTDIVLAPACGGTDAGDACSDGVFCNGEERCVQRVCLPGAPPCPSSAFSCVQISCLEEGKTCQVTPDHSRCPAVPNPQGDPEPQYCNAILGCVPGVKCETAAECQDGYGCNGKELCEGNHCIPGRFPVVDDGNECTRDGCSEQACTAGNCALHEPVPDGNHCGAGGLLICRRGTCGVSACGDGFTDLAAHEECDDGEANSDTHADRCRTNCQLPRCGDGVADFGEACDDGNLEDRDQCLHTCQPNVCGDGILNPLAEECDDGNAEDGDACLLTCRTNVCGDGFLNPQAEACDDGNQDDHDGCRSTCWPNVCGDGVVWQGVEPCDDGNTDSGDGCRGDCRKVEVCGDSVVDQGEACDDGLANPNDGCAACQRTRWQATLLTGGGTSGVGGAAQGLLYPTGVAVDPSGIVYVADRDGRRVWRVAADGRWRAVAAGFGQTSPPGAAGEQGVSAGQNVASLVTLAAPLGVARDEDGNLYIADSLANVVRKVDTRGIVSTVAGSGSSWMYGEDSVIAVEAALRRPVGVAVDRTGNIFFSEFEGNGGHQVRAVTPEGRLTTMAGSGERGFSPDGTEGRLAKLDQPMGVAVSRDHEVCFAEAGNHRVRCMKIGFGLRTVAGNGTCAPTWEDNVPATESSLCSPHDVALGPDGQLWITDSGHSVIRSVDPDGIITTVAGTGIPGFSGDGRAATEAQLNFPWDLDVDPDGQVVFTDALNGCVRKVDQDGNITTVAGGPEPEPELRGAGVPATAWPLDVPGQPSADGQGNLDIPDVDGNRVRRAQADGTIVTWSGHGPLGLQGGGFAGDDGPVREARLWGPSALARDGQGNVFISDSANARLRRVDPQGIITTVAGTGIPGFDGDGPAREHRLSAPMGLAVDAPGNVFVADQDNARVRRWAPDGTLTTVAGSGEVGFAGDDGPATSAKLFQPVAVALDGQGALYIADRKNHCIRRVKDGVITTAVGRDCGRGDVVSCGGNDQSPRGVCLLEPGGVAVDAAGRLLVADSGHSRVLAVDLAAGTVRAFAGAEPGEFGFPPRGDSGPATAATVFGPGALATDPGGNVYIAQVDGTVRKVAPDGTITTVAGLLDQGDANLALAHLVSPTALVSISPDESRWLVADGVHKRVRLVDLAAGRVRTVAGYPDGAHDHYTGSTAVLARTAQEMIDVAGVAYDATNHVAYLTERMSHVVLQLDVVNPGDPATWTLRRLTGSVDSGLTWRDGPLAEARFSQPTGLAWDSGRRQLAVVDADNHDVRVVDLVRGEVRTVAGVTGTRGYRGDGLDARMALFDSPLAVAWAPRGSGPPDLYVADTGNHCVRRIDGTTKLVSTVVGDGTPMSGGESGVPASTFPVDTPRGLAVDAYGNLWVTSRNVVRVVTAGPDGVATGEDAVLTPYGAYPRLDFPQVATGCLSGVAVQQDGARAMVLDACQGYLVQMTRAVVAP